MHVRVFAHAADGTLSEGRVWAETTGEGTGAPDGMKLDSAENLYCTGPGGIHVFGPDAVCLGVILTPEHAKRLLHALKDNIEKYEKLHGPIKHTEPTSGPVMPMNFGGPAAQA